MQTIRWGILGCGDVTEVKSGPGFQKAVGSELVAVMRRDAAKAEDYARRHGVPRWYGDADALIGDKDVDAVYIATPPGTHAFYALKVLAAGKPCYVEKPMARNAGEARRMVEAFKGAEVPLFVAYYRRALPQFLKAKELIDAGALGRVRAVNYRYADGQMATRKQPTPWRLKPEESGGGVFVDMGCHALDLLDFWCGPLKVDRAEAMNVGGQYAVEDTVQLAFTIQSGVEGTFSCSFAGGKTDEFEIIGESKELRLACFTFGGLQLRHKDGREEVIETPTPAHVAQPLIQTIVNELRGTEGACPSTGISGLRTQEVMDRVLEKYYGGREDGFWKRPWPKG